MGDTVLLTASLSELRRAYPDAEIHVAVTSDWADLIKGHPAVDKIWPYERRKEKTARAKTVASLGLKLHREHYDWVVNFHASPSSALLAFATGAKTRSIHFHGHKDANRYSTVTVPGKGIVKPNIERDLDTLRALGMDVPEGILPKIWLTDEELQKGRDFLAERGITGPLMTVSLGASRPTKRWNTPNFARVALKWCSLKGGSALVFAGPQEEELTREFFKQIDTSVIKQIHLLEPRELREFAAIVAQSSIFVGNDSGPKHVAVALGVPTVTVIGPEHPFEWHPYSRAAHPYLYVENLPCRRDALPGRPPWCALQQCTIEGHRCMKLISVDAVFNECLKVARLG